MTLRVLVCGDRHWTNQVRMYEVLDSVLKTHPDLLIVEGEARGADRMSRTWAIERGIPILRFPADWERYGRAAGPIRNQQMLDEGIPAWVFAFHDSIDESKGTRDMIARAKKSGLYIKLFTSTTEQEV